MRALAAAFALALIATPALAASPQVEAAIKVLQAIAADPAKLKTFCEMMKIEEQMGEKDDPALEGQFDKLLEQLGPEFKVAWAAVEAVAEESADGKVLHDALDQLSDKCPKLG
jgi:hypothetical protein